MCSVCGVIKKEVFSNVFSRLVQKKGGVMTYESKIPKDVDIGRPLIVKGNFG